MVALFRGLTVNVVSAQMFVSELLTIFLLNEYHPGVLHSCIHLLVCLTTGPRPLPKRALHILRSRASSFKWEHPLLTLRSSTSFLRLLPRFPVTSIPLFIFPAITCCRRQFLRKIWPIQLAFRLLISCSFFSVIYFKVHSTKRFKIAFNMRSSLF